MVSKKIKITSIILAIIAALCIAGLMIFMFKPASTQTAPDFKGMSYMEAAKLAKEQNFVVKDGQFLDGTAAEKGTIISQYPSAGSEIENGDVIIVHICRGLGDGKVPKIIDKSTEDAKSAIENAGFEVGEIKTVPGVKNKGIVISQSPKADSENEKGTKINFEVSDGTMTVVPNIIGKYYEDAYKALENASLLTKNMSDTWVYSDKPWGTVISQDIKAGTIVKKGTCVPFEVSDGEYDDEYEPDYEYDDEE